MKLCLAIVGIIFAATSTAHAQALAGSPTVDAVNKRFDSYLDVFNKNDAEAVAQFWSQSAVSVDNETGERAVGRDAILGDFKSFFEEHPGTKLTGHVDQVRILGGDVAIVEGETTLFATGDEPVSSFFSAILVQESGKWMIESSKESEIPSPSTAKSALKKLSWLIGNWRDQTAGVAVNTTVRWSANQSFLVRSYRAVYDTGELFEGSQIIGWDPRGKNYRTWVFNSDGSFGEGSVSHSDGGCRIKMSYVLTDGQTSSTTQIITRVDADTIRVEKIGQSIDGTPSPAGSSITVVRVDSSIPDSKAPAAESKGVAR